MGRASSADPVCHSVTQHKNAKKKANTTSRNCSLYLKQEQDEELILHSESVDYDNPCVGCKTEWPFGDYLCAFLFLFSAWIPVLETVIDTTAVKVFIVG